MIEEYQKYRKRTWRYLLDTAIFLKMSNFNTPNVISFLKKKTAAEM